MRLEAIGEYCICVPYEPESTETLGDSELWVPDDDRYAQYFKVISVGEGEFDEDGERVPLEVKEGDILLLAKNSGSMVTIDHQQFMVVGRLEQLAVLEQDD